LAASGVHREAADAALSADGRLYGTIVGVNAKDRHIATVLAGNIDAGTISIPSERNASSGRRYEIAVERFREATRFLAGLHDPEPVMAGRIFRSSES